MEVIKYKTGTDDPFLEDLSSRVNKFFTDNNLEKEGDIRLHIKTVILLIAFVYTYISILNHSDSWGVLFLFAFEGFLAACIGFNIMHDASHDAYSKNQSINRAMLYTLEMLGVSSFFWLIKHKLLHHFFVNTINDPDILTGGAFCLSKKDTPKKIHKYQAYYAIPIYSLEHFAWIFIFDMQKFYEKHINGMPFKMEKKDRWIFRISKGFYCFYMLVLPIYFLGLKGFIGFWVTLLVCGFFIAIVFQLAHIQPTSNFPSKEETKEKPWSVSQLEETTDFATGNGLFSRIISWFFGGLNFQTVHHLFPGISHVHYRDLSPIVEETAKDHALVYNKTSFGKALAGHFKFLDQLGNP